MFELMFVKMRRRHVGLILLATILAPLLVIAFGHQLEAGAMTIMIPFLEMKGYLAVILLLGTGFLAQLFFLASIWKKI